MVQTIHDRWLAQFIAHLGLTEDEIEPFMDLMTQHSQQIDPADPLYVITAANFAATIRIGRLFAYLQAHREDMEEVLVSLQAFKPETSTSGEGSETYENRWGKVLHTKLENIDGRLVQIYTTLLGYFIPISFVKGALYVFGGCLLMYGVQWGLFNFFSVSLFSR